MLVDLGWGEVETEANQPELVSPPSGLLGSVTGDLGHHTWLDADQVHGAAAEVTRPDSSGPRTSPIGGECCGEDGCFVGGGWSGAAEITRSPFGFSGRR